MKSVTPARNAVLVRSSVPVHINIGVPSRDIKFIALILAETDGNEILAARAWLRLYNSFFNVV